MQYPLYNKNRFRWEPTPSTLKTYTLWDLCIIAISTIYISIFIAPLLKKLPHPPGTTTRGVARRRRIRCYLRWFEGLSKKGKWEILKSVREPRTAEREYPLMWVIVNHNTNHQRANYLTVKTSRWIQLQIEGSGERSLFSQFHNAGHESEHYVESLCRVQLNEQYTG